MDESLARERQGEHLYRGHCQHGQHHHGHHHHGHDHHEVNGRNSTEEEKVELLSRERRVTHHYRYDHHYHGKRSVEYTPLIDQNMEL